MAKIDVLETHKYLTENIKNYINIIKQEYGQYMPVNVLDRLNGIEDYSQILMIHDSGEISAFANQNNIVMPLCADKLINLASKIPGYGINKNHKTYNSENMLVNNNTFFKYVMHVFISGTDAQGYYDDLLLHEVMHFCGSDGGSVLKEGINELLTRMLAQKYNLRTNSCGYPKEVRLAYELMNLFGEDVIIKLSFIRGFDKEINFLREYLGPDAAYLYFRIYMAANKEFEEKYYSYMNEFSGVTGIIKKMHFYNKIDYSNIYEIINDYKNTLVDEKNSKHL